jgi:hypothetical protein
LTGVESGVIIVYDVGVVVAFGRIVVVVAFGVLVVVLIAKTSLRLI